MKKIGLIGGMSWESSQIYYKIINEKVREQLGGFHSCISVMESVDFAQIEKLQHENNWQELNVLMVAAAKNLQNAKAEVIVLCTNTMHLCSDAIIKNVNIPFLHIVVACGEKIKTDGVDHVLLLGTKFTMESDLYKEILSKDFGVHVSIPESEDRQLVHEIIYKELVHGKTTEQSKKVYQDIIRKSIAKGIKGVILGCTEIPLLLQQKDVGVPLYDTTHIHAESAVEFALGNLSLQDFYQK